MNSLRGACIATHSHVIIHSMKFYLILSSLLLLQLLPWSNSFAQALRLGELGREIIDEERVLEIIRHSYLSDEQKISFFQQSDGDYQRYREKIRKTFLSDEAIPQAQQLFERVTKEYFFYRILENDAYEETKRQHERYARRNFLQRTLEWAGLSRRRGLPPDEREFFPLQEYQMERLAQQEEDRHLRPYFTSDHRGFVSLNRKTRQQARDFFGEELMLKGYPNPFGSGGTTENVYNYWKESLKKRIVYQYQKTESMRWLEFQMTRNARPVIQGGLPVHIRFPEVQEHYYSLIDQIDQLFTPQDGINLFQLDSFLEKNAAALTLVGNLEILSPVLLSPKKLFKIAPTHPHIGREGMRESIDRALKNALIEGVVAARGYEDQAVGQLIARHGENPGRLKELARQLDISSDQRSLMLARLYHLAYARIQLLEEGLHLTRSNARHLMNAYLAHTYHSFMDDFEQIKEEDNILLPRLLTQRLQDNRSEWLKKISELDLSNTDEDYYTRSLHMAEVLAITRLNNELNQIPIHLSYEILPLTSLPPIKNAQQNIKEYLAKKFMRDELRRYVEDLKAHFQPSIGIVHQEKGRLSREEALDYIFEIIYSFE